MAQQTLSDDAKRFVVQQLAMFETPSEVARSVKEEFGIEVSRQAVEAYDPGKRAGAALSQEFRELFAATRETFIADTASIAVTHKAVRLRTLGKLIDTAVSRGNAVLAANLLEQVAKECGDAFTNKRQVEATGKDGAPLMDGGITVTFLRPAPVPDAG
jgi:hypothetical protein